MTTVTGAEVAALHAELDAVAALMTEIARQFGPQVWQGGSAGAFAADLQGHSRALDRMAHDVMAAADRATPMPLVFPSPAPMPRVASVPAGGLVAAVSPSGLERLETALNRASWDLPNHASRIRALLPAAPTAECRRTAAWCREQAGRMRTRIRYARAEDQAAPGLAAGPAVRLGDPALIPVPDKNLFGAKEMTDLGRYQATAYAKQLRERTPAAYAMLDDIARSLQENAKDTAYLQAFFGGVPAGSIGGLAHDLYLRHEGTPLTKSDKTLIGNVGTALAGLSRRQGSGPAVTRALGPADADLPGHTLLVKLSAPNVRWSSAVLLDLAQAALRWRQRHPSYEITQSSGTLAGESHSSVINQPGRPWWHDWGLTSALGVTDDKAVRDYDPAVTILARIAAQGDSAAARALAATPLDKSLTVQNPPDAKAQTWLTRSLGETYAALLIAPDWRDGGKAAGAVIKLATAPEKGHEAEAAANAAALMKAAGWWVENGRPKVDKLLDRDPPVLIRWILPGMGHSGSQPSWFPTSKSYKAELPPELRNALLHVACSNIAALADASRTSAGTGLPRTDPATGRLYVSMGGADVQAFLRVLASDDKSWAQLAAAAQQYRRSLFAWGLRTGPIRDAMGKAGYLEGSLITAYVKERSEHEKITQKEYEDAKTELSHLRDLVMEIAGGHPAAEVPGVSAAVTSGTDKLLDKISYDDFEKRMAAIRAKDSTYSDQLALDLAYGYFLAHHGRTGDAAVDRLLARRTTLSADEQGRIINWIHLLKLSGKGSATPNETGPSLLRDAEDAAGYNQAPTQ
ncbi:hypothetical protein [Actinomadura parmotrematis]|uniref:Type I-U CRISPR-associated protein Csx17 n=1 Tax=Actinomadura parmotrematis TaxID=2864039 RepID=A0ABS7FNW7_9ACTN|nr:hypothetical protein [Actinomadura parmotrematis]MBW8482056.1 hypothetical protein [Actinomadura parmotrematis]